MTMRDEASKQLKVFTGNYQQTLRHLQEIGGGGGAMDGMAQLATNLGSVEGMLTMLGATARSGDLVDE